MYRSDMFMYKELKKQKSESKLQIGILMAKLSESEAKLKGKIILHFHNKIFWQRG